MNPTPAFFMCFFMGFFLGWVGGKQAILEELQADAPTWEEIQREVARDQ